MQPSARHRAARQGHVDGALNQGFLHFSGFEDLSLPFVGRF
jgi:hypothetical protein